MGTKPCRFTCTSIPISRSDPLPFLLVVQAVQTRASSSAGISLLVAALSQHRTISVYHLYISVILADLTTSGRVVCLINVLISHNRITKIQATLAAVFQSLFLASLGMLIYRLSADWSDSPGKCFAFRRGGLHNLRERDFVRFWVVLQMVIWFYWHLACPIGVLVFRDSLSKIPTTVRFWFSLVFYAVLDLFLWIWQLYLIAQVRLLHLAVWAGRWLL